MPYHHPVRTTMELYHYSDGYRVATVVSVGERPAARMPTVRCTRGSRTRFLAARIVFTVRLPSCTTGACFSSCGPCGVRMETGRAAPTNAGTGPLHASSPGRMELLPVTSLQALKGHIEMYRFCIEVHRPLQGRSRLGGRVDHPQPSPVACTAERCRLCVTVVRWLLPMAGG